MTKIYLCLSPSVSSHSCYPIYIYLKVSFIFKRLKFVRYYCWFWFFSHLVCNIISQSINDAQSNCIVVSATKGVKRKYIRCISGLVVYKQYLHHCSSQVALHLAHGGESSICSSAPLAGSTLLAGLRYSSPLPRLSSDPQIHNWLASGESILPLFTCWL